MTLSPSDPVTPKQILVVTMGAPGAGKSTWIRNQNFLGFYIANADAIRFDREIDVADYMNWFRFQGKKALENGQSVIVEATNTYRHQRLYWLNLALKNNIHTKLVVFNTSLPFLNAAQKVRTTSTPSSIIWKHHKMMQMEMKEIYQEPWNEIEIINRN